MICKIISPSLVQWNYIIISHSTLRHYGNCLVWCTNWESKSYVGILVLPFKQDLPSLLYYRPDLRPMHVFSDLQQREKKKKGRQKERERERERVLNYLSLQKGFEQSRNRWWLMLFFHGGRGVISGFKVISPIFSFFLSYRDNL